jgi:hypothetical protein
VPRLCGVQQPKGATVRDVLGARMRTCGTTYSPYTKYDDARQEQNMLWQAKPFQFERKFTIPQPNDLDLSGNFVERLSLCRDSLANDWNKCEGEDRKYD